ncbi:MAG: DUF2784 domain-containing protein [Cyclobacteriaceae bacterium]
MLHSLDTFFTLFHSAFVLFVLFGWAHPKTQKAHITSLLLTITAWLLIGLYVGTIGYCPLTDWHWDIKRALGETGMSSSFIGYMIEQYLGLKFTKITYDILSAGGLILGVIMAIYNHFKFKTPKLKHSRA